MCSVTMGVRWEGQAGVLVLPGILNKVFYLCQKLIKLQTVVRDEASTICKDNDNHLIGSFYHQIVTNNPTHLYNSGRTSRCRLSALSCRDVITSWQFDVVSKCTTRARAQPWTSASAGGKRGTAPPENLNKAFYTC